MDDKVLIMLGALVLAISPNLISFFVQKSVSKADTQEQKWKDGVDLKLAQQEKEITELRIKQESNMSREEIENLRREFKSDLKISVDTILRALGKEDHRGI